MKSTPRRAKKNWIWKATLRARTLKDSCEIISCPVSVEEAQAMVSLGATLSQVNSSSIRTSRLALELGEAEVSSRV